MHPCLNIDEILRLLVRELVVSGAKATAVALACCCKNFEEPALDVLWETQSRLTPLLECFPRDIWKKDWKISFNRVPTKAEWTNSRKYAQRIRKLKVETICDYYISSDIVPMLQLHAANDPWLRRLETFEFEGATEELIPFVPLLLSPKTTEIYIRFLKDAVPIMVVASTIAGLSKLCPDLERITLMDLPRDPIITEAASDLLLACNRDTLQAFCVDSPLTEKAQEIVCQLPGLSKLWVVIQGSTSLPVVALPNLTMIDVEYDDLNWLQGFRGVTLEKLESVTFSSQSEKICDPLGTFESIALAASAQKTLSEFRFETSRSWNPNYSALLSFHQLKEVAIQSSCKNGCSSRVDDNIIMSMARAMPMLETLQLGDLPCNTPAGITVNGLVGLARLCPRLSGLCIHFQAATLLEAATSPTALFPSDGESVVRQEACALTDLVVERIPIPEGSGLAIAHILLQIFPHILNVRGYAYRAREWRVVADTIDDDIRELDPSYIPQNTYSTKGILWGFVRSEDFSYH